MQLRIPVLFALLIGTQQQAADLASWHEVHGDVSALVECAGYSDVAVRATTAENDSLRLDIVDRKAFIRDRNPLTRGPQGLPFPVPEELSAGGAWVTKQVSDGWLIGFDAGEFGGGLWWLDHSGTRREKLAPDNIFAFADGPAPLVVAVGGRAHLDKSTGTALVLSGGNAWKIAAQLALGGKPRAITSHEGDIFVVIDTAVVRIERAERVSTVADGLPASRLTPVSMAAANHDLYIGFSLILGRVRLVDGSKTWFLPPHCQAPRLVRRESLRPDIWPVGGTRCECR